MLVVNSFTSSINMTILGISAYYHDSAAALLIDGMIVAAAQEERFTRVKHDNSFPTPVSPRIKEFSIFNLLFHGMSAVSL